MGELRASDTSVRGVEAREAWLAESRLVRAEPDETELFCVGLSSQLAQKYAVLSVGERINGTFEHFLQIRSVST